MPIIGAKTKKFEFEDGAVIVLRPMTKDEHAKYELERDKCRFGSGKFNDKRFDALRRQVVKKLLVRWEGFQRYDEATDSAVDWAFAEDQVDAFLDQPETSSYWQQAFAKLLLAPLKSDGEDKPVEEADPVF